MFKLNQAELCVGNKYIQFIRTLLYYTGTIIWEEERIVSGLSSYGQTRSRH